MKPRNVLACWSLVLAKLNTVVAYSDSKPQPLVNTPIDSGTFENPSRFLRPRFRYWIPDASVDHTSLASDVGDAATVGAGGLEAIGYYLYNSAAGEYAPIDWATYGWGTEAWKGVFTTLLQAHMDNDLIMDFPLGPGQGQGVPAVAGSEGLQWDTRTNVTNIAIGETFNGTVPGWGAGPLQAAVIGLVSSTSNISGPAPSLPNEPESTEGYRIQNVFAADTLQDVTEQVDGNGHLSLQVSGNATGLHYVLFTLYLVPSYLRAQVSPLVLQGPQTEPRSFRQNGSWVVDHFSSLGAQTTIDYWEEYLLDNKTLGLLKTIGHYAWEDSVEINPAGNLYWTKALPQRFLEARGYEIEKWLPVMTHQNGYTSYEASAAAETPVWYVTDEPDSGNSHVADFRETLGELYGEYLSTLNTWASERLGLQFSAQVSYNMPMDMQQNNPKVDAPECESLGFGHSIDMYRQYVGPANLAGKRVISSELGANILEAYGQTLPSLLWDVKRSIVGGVNNFIFHGMPYSGYYPNTTWPGFTTFSYVVSEMHGRRQPAWDYYSDSIDYVARLQYIFQSGVPKRDLAFYSKVTTYPSAQSSTFYWPTDLVNAGYTYDYLSPDNLDLPEAYVIDGLLAPERQSFKVLILRANNSLTVSGVSKISEYAQAGLPVLFSGGIPSTFISYNASGATYVNQTLQNLTALPNVHVVPYEGLADTLAALHVFPTTKITADRVWYTTHRRDDRSKADYFFVYNDAWTVEELNDGYSEGKVEFASTGTPYLYDAWTGEQTILRNFTRTGNSTSIFFQLAGNQSAIVAFHDTYHSNAPPVSKPLPSRSEGETLVLGDWTLVVERWDPPSDLTDLVAAKTNTSAYQLPTLVPWLELPGLQNVSGRGYYSATFTWPPVPSSNTTNNTTAGCSGAIIDFGASYHSLRVYINGQQLPPLDLTWARADISAYLNPSGEANTVQAVVATPLYNALYPIWGQLRSGGQSSGDQVGPVARQAYGLLGSVRVGGY